jgi:hypothetical protein
MGIELGPGAFIHLFVIVIAFITCSGNNCGTD